MTNKVVTLWYRAPELLLGTQEYGPPIDAWAAGCILAELLVYKPLFPANEELEQLERIFKVLGAPNERIWNGVTSLPLVARGIVDLERYQQRFTMNNLRLRLPPRTVSDSGLEVINRLLTYDPGKRATVSARLIYMLLIIYTFETVDMLICNHLFVAKRGSAA